MSEEIYTSGGGFQGYVDPKKLKKMKELWNQSKGIRALSIKHHEEKEVPQAEEELLKDLEEVNNNKKAADN